MKNKLSINSSKISRSSCEVFEDAQFSPTKMAKRFHSPTDLIKRERQARMSEKKLPFFKLNLESSNNPNGSCASSWSSFTSFEDKNLEFSPLSKLNPTQISNNIIKNSMEIPNLDLEPNDQKNVILQAHIKTPSNFMYQSKSKDTITIPKLNFEKKGSFDLIEPIIEEGSPLAKILRKKKQQDKLSNVLAQNEKDKNVLVNFKEISTNSENLINGHIFRHLIFAPKVNENLFKQHLLITYKGIVYANKLSQPSEKFLEERGILLPEKKNSNFLFFI